MDVCSAVENAHEYRYGAVEIHDIKETSKQTLNDIYRSLIANRLKISCIDMTCDIAKNSSKAFTELEECAEAAARLRCGYIRLKAESGDSVYDFIKRALPVARKNGVVLPVSYTHLTLPTNSRV